MTKTTEEHRKTAFDMFATGAKREEVAEALSVDRSTVSNWIRKCPEFGKAHREAKQVYADELAESLIALAEKPIDGNPKLANAEIQRRRLLADNIKWISSKLLPKVYGDKIQLEGEVIHNVSPLAQLRKLEQLRASKPPAIEAGTVPEEEEEPCF
jgi:transposase-like protein